MTDIRAQLQAAFEAELAEHLAAMRAGLAAAARGTAYDLRDIFRRAHSLKGAARAVVLPQVEARAHALETLLADVETGGRTLDAEAIAIATAELDAIEDAAAPAPQQAAATQPDSDRLRISGAALERLGRSLHVLAGETRAQADRAEELRAIESELRALATATSADGAVAQRLARAASNVARLRRDQTAQGWRLDRATAELEHDAQRIMLVPVATLFDGLDRMARDIAAEQGKQVALDTSGDAIEADRRVLQQLRDPLVQLIRNAVGHGIEAPAPRTGLGKPAQGQVHVRYRTEQGRLRLIVEDDGRGLDPAAIEARARDAGLIARSAPRPPARELYQLLFEQGFSTARGVDAISGRGVGLAIVAEAMRRLHGQAEIAPRRSAGTRVVLTVPLALTRQTVLLVEAAGQSFGIPAEHVRGVRRIAAADIAHDAGGALLVTPDGPVPIASLAAILGLAADVPPGHALLLQSGESRVAIAVHALHDVRTLAIGDPTAVAANAPLVYGTAVLGDEAVLLVLGARRLAAAAQRRSAAGAAVGQPAQSAERRARTILVVDDSITTRTLEKSILEAQGYRVLSAVDGIDGLERLRSGEALIDLVIADVEMPRLDGFGLLAAIRNDPALNRIPVVMMTSRNSPADIQRGLDLGADAYVTKQDFDQGRLLGVVGQLV